MKSEFSALVATTTAVVIALAAAADLDLVLMHANDMHSCFDEMDVHGNECHAVHENAAPDGECYGGLARIAGAVSDEKRKAADKGVPSLFVVAGDTFQGTAYFSFFKWKPVVDFVKQLNPDVMTLGNHEFDDGIGSLVSYLKGIQGIPTVVSNLNMTSEPDLNKLVLPSLVLTINNTKVGIVGYLTTETPGKAITGAVEFVDEVKSLKKETKKLRENGVKIIIGLGHSGIKMDEKVARQVEDIDLIVGGHSHTFLYSGSPPSIEKPYGPYPFYVKNVKNKVVPILHAYAYTKYIGKVNLRFDSNGDLVNIDGLPILLNHEIKQDPLMLNVLKQWKPNVTKITNVTIGHTDVELINHCLESECNIGNLMADSFVNYNIKKRNAYGEKRIDAPIGIVLGGSVRASINETNHDGRITLGQLINVTPFINALVKVTIDGSSLLETFEYSVYDYITPHGSGKFLQVSGILVEFDLTQKPGHRVSSLLVRRGNCTIPIFKPLVLTANYTLIVNSYLAKGRNGFEAFKRGVNKYELLDTDDYHAVATYISAISPVKTGTEGRIRFKNNQGEKSKAPKTRHRKSL